MMTTTRCSARFRRGLRLALFAGFAVWLSAAALAHASDYIGGFSTVTEVAPTVPANGDLNPYGVAVVPRSVGNLHQGHILVSNFNNSLNQQGTGTTIMDIDPVANSATVFAQLDPAHLPGRCPGGVGLTTALVVLRAGWVIVGSLPTVGGVPLTMQAGCLIVLNAKGNPVETLAGRGINGPWDMTAFDGGSFAVLFVSNVLNGTVAVGSNDGPGTVVNKGTVLRIVLAVNQQGNDNGEGNENGQGNGPTELARTIIASGFGERTDVAALVIGPTGVGLASDGTLYVADTLNSRIAAIPNALFRVQSAGTGNDVSSGGSLNMPLGLAIAPNGDILTVNAADGNIVETTPAGTQVETKTLDSSGAPPGAGTLFGLAVVPGGGGVYFVDDGENQLNLFH